MCFNDGEEGWIRITDMRIADIVVGGKDRKVIMLEGEPFNK